MRLRSDERTLQPPEVACQAPLLRQQLANERLREAGGRLCAALVRTLEALGKDGVARRPAKTRARADCLCGGKQWSGSPLEKDRQRGRTKESVDADDASLVVDVKVRRNEALEKLVVRLGDLGPSCGAKAGVMLVLAGLQEVIGCASTNRTSQQVLPNAVQSPLAVCADRSVADSRSSSTMITSYLTAIS